MNKKEILNFCEGMAREIHDPSVKIECLLSLSHEFNKIKDRESCLRILGEAWATAVDHHVAWELDWVLDETRKLKTKKFAAFYPLVKKANDREDRERRRRNRSWSLLKKDDNEGVYFFFCEELISILSRKRFLDVIHALSLKADRVDISGEFNLFVKSLVLKNDPFGRKILAILRAWPADHDATLDDISSHYFEKKQWKKTIATVRKMIRRDTQIWSLMHDLLGVDPRSHGVQLVLDFVNREILGNDRV
jgi:hypothetical protein